MILPDNHIILTSSPDIKEICRPLFESFGITFFEFIRIYNDGSRFSLTNYPERTKQMYETDYKDSTDYDTNLTLPKTGFVLWQHGLQHLPKAKRFLIEQKIRDGKNLFNVDNGIALFENTLHYHDYYNFGTTPENTHLISFYLNNLDILQLFILYFKDKAQHLILHAEKNRVKPPIFYRPNLTSCDYEANEQGLLIKRTDFIKKLNIKRFFLDGEYSNLYFTRREYECINLAAKGKSLKEIGISLNLSPRTVETHLEKAKNKLGCISLSELIDIFLSSNLSFIK